MRDGWRLGMQGNSMSIQVHHMFSFGWVMHTAKIPWQIKLDLSATNWILFSF
jgi:hypothetical protein